MSRLPAIAGNPEPGYKQDQLVYKKRSFAPRTLNIVTPSAWLARCAQESTLFSSYPVHVIPNGLDLDVFKPIDKARARKEFGLPADKKIILFVSQSIENRRKGFDLLQQALAQANDEYLVCSVGHSCMLDSNSNYISLGKINDEQRMMLAYNAADAFVIPSREDNLPNVALESIACGVPVIGFNIGGLPEIVKHGHNGLLSSQVNAAGLASAISDFFSGKFNFERAAIRKDAESRYGAGKQAAGYSTLYFDILKSKSR